MSQFRSQSPSLGNFLINFLKTKYMQGKVFSSSIEIFAREIIVRDKIFLPKNEEEKFANILVQVINSETVCVPDNLELHTFITRFTSKDLLDLKINILSELMLIFMICILIWTNLKYMFNNNCRRQIIKCQVLLKNAKTGAKIHNLMCNITCRNKATLQSEGQ